MDLCATGRPVLISAPRTYGIAAIVVCVTLWPSSVQGQVTAATRSIAELKKLSVEELLAIQVTSVSRTEERLGDAPAAVAVVTSEDIRRSGATSVPEALRHVPGIHVARESASTWAVSSRGFGSVNSEKLLVLSDTRSVYTPLFSGVFWDVQDYLLQDIDRIEVIRGPGATLWGSNAVNGVINITTKSARDTQGLYAETSLGTEERAAVAARYGGQMANGAYYRIFAKYFDRGATSSSTESPDDWQMGRFGFRSDWEATARDTWTVQGDVYRGDIGQLAPSVTVIGRPGPAGRLRVGVTGGHVLTRWTRVVSPGSDIQLRLYYDRTHRDDPSFTDTLDTVDLDFQHRFAGRGRHAVTWNANYRVTANDNRGAGIFAVDPSFSRDQVVSGFAQDRIRLLDPLHVTVGAKVEHNDFSGTEVQPSGRVAWDPLPGHMAWGAISRAVRVPTRFERDIAIDVTNPSANPLVRLLGNRDFGSEDLLAYEVGYRWQARPAVSIDTTAFHNRYEGLTSLELGAPFPEPGTGRSIIPLQNQNLTEGRARGIETLVTYAPVVPLRLTASYSHLDLRLDPRGADLNRGRFLAGSTPRHQFALRSYLDLPARFQFDVMFRRLGRIRQIPQIVTGEGLGGYAELDVRLAWDGWRRMEISLVGQNLLHGRHAEFGAPADRGEIERGVYAKLAWGF
jgi:iron complex outermembrane recepter protein